RAHPDAFRAGKLVVRAVADEDRLHRLHAQLVAGKLVDPRIRLPPAARAGEDLRVEEAGERRLGPDVDRVLAAHRDQPGTKPTVAQFAQGVDDPFTRSAEQLPGERTPQLEEVAYCLLLDPQREEIRRHRPRLAH